MKPTTAELAAALIASFEGERLTAYQDSGGVWTIGIGHTKDVQPGEHITHEQAVQFFIQDCSPLLALVSGFPTTKAAALVSFGFNCGLGRLQDVLQGKDSIDLPRHTQDRHGNVLPGLVARRRIEKMLIDLA
jgi:GH24 family phage-related lysozyme (muramidase)